MECSRELISSPQGLKHSPTLFCDPSIQVFLDPTPFSCNNIKRRHGAGLVFTKLFTITFELSYYNIGNMFL
jgi:hypothetical protein